MSAVVTPEPEFAALLDASGLRCPEPVMLLHNAIRKLAVGEVLKLVATDPSTQRDVHRFCTYLGHGLVAASVEAGVFCYFIRRGGG
jgi:tRNA 2-thiouridine synthesizing protein A